jgi:hypothetical protein
MTPYDLKEEEQTHFVVPRLRLREIQFSSIATVGALVHQPNTAHHNTYFEQRVRALSSLSHRSPRVKVNIPYQDSAPTHAPFLRNANNTRLSVARDFCRVGPSAAPV